MNPILRGIGQFGNNAENALVKVATPIAKATVMPAVNIGSTILGNIAHDVAPPKTQQLPPGVQSPIPQSNIVPHQQAGSWLGMGINSALGALSSHMPRVLPSPQQQGVPLQAPIQHPAQPIVNHMVNRFSPTATPQPTTAPTQRPTTMPTSQPAILGARSNPVVSPQQPAPTTDFEQATLPVFHQYGVSPAVAYGIAAAEGGKIGQNNIWNINATDSNPQGATNYGNVQQAAQGAAQLIQRMLQARGVASADPNVQLQAVEQSGYAGDPRTWQQRSASTGGAGRQFRSWSDFVKSTPAWRKWIGQQQ